MANMSRAYYRDYAQKNMRQKYAAVAEMKKAPCTDCGVTYPPTVMEFDHVRGKKEMSVSQLIGQRASWARIMKEIKKCELVCANCHRLRTYGEAQDNKIWKGTSWII